MDLLTATKMAKLLDESRADGADWHMRASGLGLGALIPALQHLTSPTKALLDNFEVCNFNLHAIIYVGVVL